LSKNERDKEELLLTLLSIKDLREDKKYLLTLLPPQEVEKHGVKIKD